jgi:lipopolysaccharide/colanic/teichoic acid biosynthesis glycosyltransferase
MLSYLQFERSDILPNDDMVRERLSRYLPIEAVDYFIQNSQFDLFFAKVLDTGSCFNIENMQDEVHTFFNLKRCNDIRYINKFFEAVNNKLPVNGVFLGRFESSDERRKRITGKYHPSISYPYYAVDFLLKRVTPKTKLTRKLYFLLTRGENRVLTLPEVLGRLVACGFAILDYREIAGMIYFAAKKIRIPFYDMYPSYGPLFKMRRVGQNGKVINVYKLRTMHPYAEYLQDYIFQKNNLDEGGKFKDDFRISSWGNLMRKLWIDELPMLYNWLKRDLKLVGVRPLSSHYLNLYSKELIDKRLKYKPGLVPPFYYDMPKTLTEIMASEIKYLDEYEKRPILTDIKYFSMAFYNIVVKRARSK